MVGDFRDWTHAVHVPVMAQVGTNKKEMAADLCLHKSAVIMQKINYVF